MDLFAINNILRLQQMEQEISSESNNQLKNSSFLYSVNFSEEKKN